MIEKIVFILWVLLAPVIDGLIYPKLIYYRFYGQVPVWVYLVYFGVFFMLGLFMVYSHEVDKE
jgi:hypothetical protein